MHFINMLPLPVASSGHLNESAFGLAVYADFPSVEKRTFLTLQYFQTHQLPPPSRLVLFSGAEEDIQGPDQNLSAKICHSICQSSRRGHQLI